METLPPPRVAVIADDLTGACDTTVQFVRRRYSTMVWRSLEGLSASGTDVIACSLNSRADTAEQVKRKVYRACSDLRSVDPCRYYLKLDSTLRGDWASHIEALMSATDSHLAVVAPACPEMERRLVDGALEAPGIARNHTTHLPSLLEDQGLRSVAHIPLSNAIHKYEPLLTSIRNAIDRGEQVLVVDAQTGGHLDLIVNVCRKLPERLVWAGSSGLAGALAAAGCPSFDVRYTTATTFDRGNACPTMFLIGSEDEVTASQIEALNRIMPHEVFIIPDCNLQKIARALAAKKPVLIQLRCDDPRMPKQLVPLVNLLHDAAPAGVVMSGGYTAELVLHALGWEALKLLGELQPGVPWGRIRGGPCAGMLIATKSGRFGDDTTLVRAAEFFNGKAGVA